MVEADTEPEHGDVDDPTVAPPGVLLSGELVRGGPSGSLPMETAAIFHDEPSRSGAERALECGLAQAAVGETRHVTCDCDSNACSGPRIGGPLSESSGWSLEEGPGDLDALVEVARDGRSVPLASPPPCGLTWGGQG